MEQPFQRALNELSQFFLVAESSRFLKTAGGWMKGATPVLQLERKATQACFIQGEAAETPNSSG